jgi:methyltransferase family protein
MAYPTVMPAPTTRTAQEFWLQPRTDEAWASLWDKTEQPHRQMILQQFHLLNHFKSITEVGAQVGTNIRLLRRAFPWATVTGIELNPSAVAFARKQFADDSMVTFVQGGLTDPTPLPPTDVILTCYSLAYVAGEDILIALKRLLAAARVGLVIAEPQRQFISQLVPGLHFPEWMHPFDALLAAELAGRRGKLIVRKVDPPVDRLNMIVTAAYA